MSVSESIAEEIRNACSETEKVETEIIDERAIRVRMIDWTRHPYWPMVNGALMTWGKSCDKWDMLSPEARFHVVNEVLHNHALPLAKELPVFTFLVENVSRACFDQIARARIGVSICAKGFKDNNLRYLDFIVPERIQGDLRTETIEHLYRGKRLYAKLQAGDVPNWAARAVIPMYSGYSFLIQFNYAALQGFCFSRMETTEMPDVVSVAWLMRDEVGKQFPLLAEYLRPGCDFKHKDRTLEVNGFPDILGIPHESDGRQMAMGEEEDFKKNYRVINNEPCTQISDLSRWFKIKIPGPNSWKELTWETLSPYERGLFGEEGMCD